MTSSTHQIMDTAVWPSNKGGATKGNRRNADIFRWLADYIILDASQMQNQKRRRLSVLGVESVQSPYIIGLGGSVASGKSTFVQHLLEDLKRAAPEFEIEAISTDGFLLSNRQLAELNLTSRKGFPETYDREALVRFVQAINRGMGPVECPVYSHSDHDVSLRDSRTINIPDIIVLEGLNVLQTGRTSLGEEQVFISDYFDLSLFLDAEEVSLERWYTDRFSALCRAALSDTRLYHYQFRDRSPSDIIKEGARRWREINRLNLLANILPTRSRADIIFHKADDHSIDRVAIGHRLF